MILQNTEVDKAIYQKFRSDPDLVLNFLIELGEAIKHIHDRDFAHCDIAPKNIFIQYQGDEIKLILGDLGISKSIKPAKDKELEVIGSKSWMPSGALKYLDKKNNTRRVFHTAALLGYLFFL